MIVDAHCHVAPNWYQPVESLLFEMDRAGVERALLVQLLGRTDNAYQSRCAAAWPDRLASIVAVDDAAPNAVDQLAALAEAGAAGVRLRPTGAPALWRAAARLGLPVSCVGPANAFVKADFIALVRALPDLVVVLEHLGGVARPDAEGDAEGVFGLAALPNVFLKVPGLGQLSLRPGRIPSEGAPFDLAKAAAPIARAAEAFGPGRLMWGSDFPPVAAREGYGNALAWTRQALEGQGVGGIDEIFGGTARQLFWREHMVAMARKGA